MKSLDTDPHAGSFVFWTAVLLVLIVTSLMMLELGAYGVDRRSRIQRRLAGEYAGALTLSGHAPGTAEAVLIVGNSLLVTNVDFPRLHSALLPEFDTRRLAMESTTYHDWYYGLRRLFRRGAQPDVVVVMLSTDQLVASGVRGEYFAQYLMQVADVPRLSRELDLHPTVAGNLLFGGLSRFYGLRSEIRKWVLVEILPDFPKLTSLLTPSSQTSLSDAEFFLVATRRVRALQALAREHDARLILALPPLRRREAQSALVKRAGNGAGVPVLSDYDPAIYLAQDYADGFHLNEAGAAKYTARLIPRFRELLSRH
jgi:hypothetical protein